MARGAVDGVAVDALGDVAHGAQAGDLLAELSQRGSRDFQFIVSLYEDVFMSNKVPVIGHDPSQGAEDEWPPPYCVRDPISGRVKLYHKGSMRPATEDECRGLEPTAVWDLHHLVDPTHRGRPRQLITGDLSGSGRACRRGGGDPGALHVVATTTDSIRPVTS